MSSRSERVPAIRPRFWPRSAAGSLRSNVTANCCATPSAGLKSCACVISCADFGDGTKGWPEQAPYERVLVTAAAPGVPAILVDSLAPGGILVVPVGEDHRDQQLVRIRREDDRFSTEDLGLVRFVPLVAGLPRRPADQGLT